MKAFAAKTFGYRRLYVNAILERAPHRAVLAVYAEVVRLSFVLVGSALVALIFGLLFAGAAARGAVVWASVAAVCAAAAIASGTAGAVGVRQATRDLPRVRRAAEAS